MRINDRELLEICTSTPIFEGRLNYRPPGGNFGQSGFKERWFRLRCNMLFYYRISEAGKVESEPSGVFVMENSNIQLENSSSIPFAFSIIFKDEPYKKHVFSGRSDENIQSWISYLRQCTYEYLRSQRIILQKEITLKTGKDPLLMYPYNEGAIRDFEVLPSSSEEGSPKLTRTTVPLTSSVHLRDKSPLGKSFQSHLAPVAPPRSSSPKALMRATHPPPSLPKAPLPVTTSPILPVRAAPLPVTTSPILPVRAAPLPVTTSPILPVRAAPLPVATSPILPVRAAPLPVTTSPVLPVRAAPLPVTTSPKLPVRAAPSAPTSSSSSEINLIDL